MSLAFLIAHRLYSTKNAQERLSTLGVNIATIGIAVGLAVMIVSVAIVLGFKGEIRNKVIGFGASIQVLNSDAGQQPDAYPLIANSQLRDKITQCTGVTHLQRISQKMGILKTDSDFGGIMYKGVGEDFDTTFIAAHLVEGYLPDYSDNSHTNDIVISRAIAKSLGLKCGEKVFAYFFDDDIRMRRYHIAGIYETNMMQFDNSVVIASRTSVNKLNSWDKDDCTALEISVKDFSEVDNVADAIAELTPTKPDANGCFYGVYTIKELYSPIFDWLKLLDLNIWVILGLMIAVCCFTMISGLLILILEKTNTIGMLKAVGARNAMVRHVFLHYGIFIIGRGLIWGNALALLLCYLQWQFHIFGLDASTYYVAYVPIIFNWPIIILLNISTLLICSVILIGPTLVVSHIKPVKALKFD